MSKALLLLAFAASTASASFLETSKRYVSPSDMMSLLTQKFPVLDDPQLVRQIKIACWTMGGANTNVTGLVNPAIGLPATTRPGAGFVRWWGDCADRIINNQFADLAAKPADGKLWRRFWAPAILDRFRDGANPADPYHKLRTSNWDALSQRNKDEQIRFLIEEWIGPNPVIKDMKFVQGTDELVELIKSSVTGGAGVKIFDANKKLILAVMLREEFLSY